MPNTSSPEYVLLSSCDPCRDGQPQDIQQELSIHHAYLATVATRPVHWPPRGAGQAENFSHLETLPMDHILLPGHVLLLGLAIAHGIYRHRATVLLARWLSLLRL